MEKHSSSMTQVTNRHEVFRLRQLLDEFHLQIGSFPDLHDAFDADELPLAFILRRDSRLTKASAGPPQTFSGHANNSVPRRPMSFRTHSRGGRRKQMSDE